MKRPKRLWAWKDKHKYNRKPIKLSQYDKWFNIKPIKYGWGAIRMNERINIRKLLLNSDDVVFYNKKQCYRDYY